MFTAKEAEAWGMPQRCQLVGYQISFFCCSPGLVSKVLPPADVIPEAVKLAELIASKPRIAVLMAKEAVKAGKVKSEVIGYFDNECSNS